ncbi:hypothetical protein [Abditibacterium utsteinense]|uniref:hypothetical protein n=1 Tax=Abditibacterium utsteinense TaxID=1960156 RepID=UPI00130045D9|nr:hypothetical protein [Abditibacterium utsteinense]
MFEQAQLEQAQLERALLERTPAGQKREKKSRRPLKERRNPTGPGQICEKEGKYERSNVKSLMNLLLGLNAKTGDFEAEKQGELCAQAIRPQKMREARGSTISNVPSRVQFESFGSFKL